MTLILPERPKVGRFFEVPYDRYAYLPEKEEALVRWNDYLAQTFHKPNPND
jgi:hypothetical protein